MNAFDILSDVGTDGRCSFALADFPWIERNHYDTRKLFLREAICSYLHPLHPFISQRFQRTAIGYKEAHVQEKDGIVSFNLAPILLLPHSGNSFDAVGRLAIVRFEHLLRHFCRFFRYHEKDADARILITNNRNRRKATYGKIEALFARHTECEPRRYELSPWNDRVQQWAQGCYVPDWLRNVALDLNRLGPGSWIVIRRELLIEEPKAASNVSTNTQPPKEEKMTSAKLNVVPVQAVVTMENSRLNIRATLVIPNIKKLPQIEPDVDAFTDIGDGPDVGNEIRVFRHYPLAELEARSLHFKGSSPLQWIEEHMRDLLTLELFKTGFDARYIDRFDFEYVPFLIQEEESDPRSPLVQHIYTWTFDRQRDELVLTDNGDEILKQSARGPQPYLWLHDQERDIRALAVRPQAVTETIRKD
jgi:hypothetical protein